VKPVHVIGRGFFTPTFPTLAAFRAGTPDPEATRPAVDFVPSRNKRGCSVLTLAAAEVAHQACVEAGVSASEPALVFGSCHGEMEIAVAQMEMFQQDKGLLSPARFKNSVHNTGAGMFSIAMDNRGYATAIAGGHDTVALSLLEAMLLLGTAFVILLGRTAAGVFLTDFIDADGPLSGLRLENISALLMDVFNTAGNRAIMIGVALGTASVSLKILLGVDRSYLGSSEE